MKFNSNLFKIALKKYAIFRHFYCTKGSDQNTNLRKIRNIGISAHIDAGKTTTTERMLYYAGLIDHMGEVHDGNTFTDYMEQERQRGITITSAAVTFPWKGYLFNLIDTPGHIDFTMEVEQTLNVLDGVVVILDGSAGVEAQTLTVWRQADRYNIPRIIYANKMDRPDSNIDMCCASIQKKLEVPPVLLQLPFHENGKLVGILDVLTSELIRYGQGDEKKVMKMKLTESNHPELYTKVQKARHTVIDTLTDFDDELADKVINLESYDDVVVGDVIKALQNVTNKKTAVPVVLGSSYKNVGVQSLMDSVIHYLPSPLSTVKVFSHFKEQFCGRAFKVVHDKQRGPLVFLRIYNGAIKKGQKIYSIQRDASEQVGRVYVAYADDFKEVEMVSNGNIAVVSGLKHIMSGDLLTNTQMSYEKAKKGLLSIIQKTENTDTDSIFGISAKVPEPVFFCSIEPPSMATQTALDKALLELQREDPSLRVSYNSETGQTELAGMGELHLDIIRDRILKEYKIEADLGPLQISYREAAINNVTDTLKVETKIGSTKHSVLATMSLIPTDKNVTGDVLRFDKTPDNASNLAGIYPKHMSAIRQGIKVGLMQGPKISCPVIGTNVMLHWFEVGRGTSDTVISASITQLVHKLLKASDMKILEPIMEVEIVSPSEHLSSILSDLSQRRALIRNIDSRGNTKIISTYVPLSELLGYATDIRTISSGTATFATEFHEYQAMSLVEEENAIRRVRGF